MIRKVNGDRSWARRPNHNSPTLSTLDHLYCLMQNPICKGENYIVTIQLNTQNFLEVLCMNHRENFVVQLKLGKGVNNLFH